MTPYKKTVAAFADCDESKVNHLNEKHMLFNRPFRYISFNETSICLSKYDFYNTLQG